MKRADLLPRLTPLLTSVFLWNMTMAQDATISCHFTPANVTEGEGANLTCTFPVDIQENAKDFYVQMSNDTVFDINENVIVRCFWLNPPGPSPNCSMEKEYAKLIVKGDTVTIGIPDAITDQTGYYKCSMVNPGPDIARHPCVFSVAESSSSGSSGFPTETIIVIVVVGVVALAVAVAVVVAVRCNLMESPGHIQLIVTGFIWAVVVCQEVVVDCSWPKDTSGPYCTMSEGYAKPTIDGFTVTINILNAKKEQAGYYKCLVVNLDPPSTPNICNVSVAERSSSGSSDFPTWAIIVIVAGVVAVAVAVVVAVRCDQNKKCRNCYSRQHRRPGRASNNGTANVLELVAMFNKNDDEAAKSMINHAPGNRN